MLILTLVAAAIPLPPTEADRDLVLTRVSGAVGRNLAAKIMISKHH